MDNVVNGINESELCNLSLEILDRADSISLLFDKLDNCMDKLPTCYQGDPCKKLIEHYKELSSNYSTIKNNIVSYSDDLVALIRKMNDEDKKLTSLFNEYTADINNQTKNIVN